MTELHVRYVWKLPKNLCKYIYPRVCVIIGAWSICLHVRLGVLWGLALLGFFYGRYNDTTVRSSVKKRHSLSQLWEWGKSELVSARHLSFCSIPRKVYEQSPSSGTHTLVLSHLVLNRVGAVMPFKQTEEKDAPLRGSCKNVTKNAVAFTAFTTSTFCCSVSDSPTSSYIFRLSCHLLLCLEDTQEACREGFMVRMTQRSGTWNCDFPVLPAVTLVGGAF